MPTWEVVPDDYEEQSIFIPDEDLEGLSDQELSERKEMYIQQRRTAYEALEFQRRVAARAEFWIERIDRFLVQQRASGKR